MVKWVKRSWLQRYGSWAAGANIDDSGLQQAWEIHTSKLVSPPFSLHMLNSRHSNVCHDFLGVIPPLMQFNLKF